jgi:hypothetical protein
MNINITYPELSKKRATREKLIRILRLPFVLSAFACPIVNIAVGGPAWSVVSLFGLYMIWNLAVAIDLIEYNRTSQFIKFITYSIIMLILIDTLLTPDYPWGAIVIPIVTFSGLVVAAVLFFTDFERQRHNLMPLLIIDILCLLAAAGMIIYIVEYAVDMALWPYIVMGSVSLALLISFAFTLKGGLIAELKRRFHAKII